MILNLQKAAISKRLSAYIFDFIIFCIIAVGLATLFSLAVGYDGYVDELENYRSEYEERYGIKIDITEEEYSKLSEEERQNYDNASEACKKDERVLKASLMMMSLSVVILSVSILASYIITEFAVPLFFKNGQTLGKKIFGIALMRVDGVKISTFQLFVRTVFGKYTIETMIPVLLVIMVFFGTVGIVGPIVIGLILLLQIICISVTKTNSAIHDLMAVTVVVDIHSQRIFDSERELVEYKQRIAAERAEDIKYR